MKNDRGVKHFSVLILSSVLAWQANVAGQTVQVRDAMGGENAEGEPGWYFLTGTGGFTQGTNGHSEFFRDLHTGTFDLELDFAFGSGGSWQEFLTYCLELNEDIGFGTNESGGTVGLPFEVVSLSSISGNGNADQVFLEKLWANAIADSTTSPIKAAAFQSLVWEVMNDDSIDLESGGFMLDENDSHTSHVLEQANTWIDNINDGTWTSRTELMALSSPDSQDLIIPIPEPATLSLLALGAGAILRRRIR